MAKKKKPLPPPRKKSIAPPPRKKSIAPPPPRKKSIAPPPPRKKSMATNTFFLLALLSIVAACAAHRSPDTDADTTTHIVILSDRILGASVVLNSTCTSAARPSTLSFHVITGREGALVLPMLFRDIASCSKATLTVETVESATEALQRRGFFPFWRDGAFAKAAAAIAEGEWGVRTPYHDDKHAAPLNHLRFYLPHLPALDGVGSFIFMDDDIVVQKDVAEFMRLGLAPGKAMAAGCQHWRWSPKGFVTSHDVTMRDTGYMGAVDTACPDGQDGKATMGDAGAAPKSCVRGSLMGELRDTANRIANDPSSTHEHLRGSTAQAHPLDRTAFNMGFNLIDVAAWQRMQLTEHYEQWVAASVGQKLFPPDSLAFGLVIAYLALGDAVQCYDSQLTHLVGLAFIPQERLEEGYGWTAQRMESDAFALHFNGAHKPWAAPMPDCEEMAALAERPRSAVDIWRRHCGKFCPCGDGSAARNPRVMGISGRRLESAGNEYVLDVPDKEQETSAASTPATGTTSLVLAVLVVTFSSTL